MKLKAPERITSVTLRKYTATVTQVSVILLMVFSQRTVPKKSTSYISGKAKSGYPIILHHWEIVCFSSKEVLIKTKILKALS